MTEATFALRAVEPLAEFNRGGVLAPADVHVAQRLTAIAGIDDPLVALAVAFAVRGPRLGHVYVDLATIRSTATSDLEEPIDVDSLPWPAADEWVAAVAAGGLAPLRLDGTRLYLDRYWCAEEQLAAD